VRSEAPKAPGVQRAKPFGRLKYLASDRYQPAWKNFRRKTQDSCKQYWHSFDDNAREKVKNTVLYRIVQINFPYFKKNCIKLKEIFCLMSSIIVYICPV
jgi:hypothetical protein